jgi:hypothetical protein
MHKYVYCRFEIITHTKLAEKLVILAFVGLLKIIHSGFIKRVLLPSKRFASTLYKRLSNEYYAYLDSPRVKSAIEKNRRGI